MSDPVFDIFIVGGGINGCGIARDAAGRGYSVCLAEMNDLASGTSSASTKLIHGGLRYLEHYEFRLVRESLKEREVLWAMAPHIIWPLRFVLPHHKGLRPAWLLRLGLFLYDHIGGRKRLPATKVRDLRQDPLGAVLKPGQGRAFEYSDCWVDDARLVVLTARDAADRGAEIHTRTRMISAHRVDDHWEITIQDDSGHTRTVRARMLVNAAGPWVSEVLSGLIGGNESHDVRLVKGSHIVVRKLYDDPRCFFFQNADGRIFFSIPYQGDFTLIGTTDQDFDGDPASVDISPAETDYLLAAANQYFRDPIGRDDIVWTYSGVRPLYNDGASRAQEATRDYVLKHTGGGDTPTLLNVFGGKLTTYRRLAESALEHIETALGRRGDRWTSHSSLPGGDFSVDGFADEVENLQTRYPFLSTENARRFVRAYGTLSRTILGDARTAEDLGPDFGCGLTGAEVRYQVEREWARSADDILWRRSKLGLHGARIDRSALDSYIYEALRASG
ncbi:glycerol-3-phosphate dehydrogenase [Pelagibacterium halotolerans]|uniref:Glycerol-3-phosphate dehydrogenase n=1 Tax=Pelagibacterium halotolerans (strain DSM 22347 / JCM 15775 / CGMCC 1.7692 / B2) TaxID=1082931 RepID=G4RFY0_PELHB|nr:glycerol-3-phosphate dehydrogenase [Pelagibacterium halotolerans]AEQ51023.1 aerobic glycerol-3-phosphate dehydrogenase [Pelagibacterium halotolerans B2]QJR19087.1 glycerol-3-phosphate dehydrogenase [Pelagibacterium halotolerans]SEA02768.1 homodimeric glycerol 3-phosphate dehydrogenase (quinone) [Pelagibacterium halotolerans]